MGIHDFTKIMKASAQVTYKELAAQDFAVDAYPELFRSSSMQYAAKLLNPAGEPTLHINVAFANAVRRRVLGAEDIWCWDSRDPRPAGDSKRGELAARAAKRVSNADEIARVQALIERQQALARRVPRADLLRVDPLHDSALLALQAQHAVLSARNPSGVHFDRMILDIQFMLGKLGVQLALAPAGCDAEKLAAQLCREGLVDGVITVDTDAMVYGAPVQVKKIAGKSGQYELYRLQDCLDAHQITREQLAQVATVMGCDFCDKTPGVGAKTVVKKVLEGKIQYTQQQLAAQKKFLDTRAVRYELRDSKCTAASLDELTEWLVVVQGFNRERVVKSLLPLRK